jgi:hypothetical protein
MNTLKKIAGTIFIICAIVLSSFAQSTTTTTESDIFYVRIDNLNTDNYAVLYHKLKADGRFTIDLACVPAHVLKIKMIGDRSEVLSENLNAFQELTAQAQLASPRHLADFDAQKFFDACAATRSNN